MTKIIIGIHGLGNKPPEKLLKKWWRISLREGLKGIGHPFQLFRFDMVYWANFLHPQPLDPRIVDKENVLYLEFPYAPSRNSVRRPPNRLRRMALDLLEKGMDKIFLNEDMTLNFPQVAELIIRKYFKDLESYYSAKQPDADNSEVFAKEVIREKLATTLRKHRKKDIMLIAHSMGSIVAYDVLTRYTPEVKIDTLVTIGSPLGQPIVMGKISAEQEKDKGGRIRLRTPENVVNGWYNFSDLDDKVTMNYNLADDYDENSLGVRAVDQIVENDYEYLGKYNPHKSYGYLRTTQVAQVVSEFLNRDQTRAGTWLTEKINRFITGDQAKSKTMRKTT
jgi:hypothetical protein